MKTLDKNKLLLLEFKKRFGDSETIDGSIMNVEMKRLEKRYGSRIVLGGPDDMKTDEEIMDKSIYDFTNYILENNNPEYKRANAMYKKAWIFEETKNMSAEKAKKYEDKFLYRLNKVLYIFSLVIAIIIVGFVGWENKPHDGVIDQEKSFVLCKNEKKYYLKSLTNSFENYGGYVPADAKQEATEICAYGKRLSTLDSYAVKIPTTQNYSLQIYRETNGSWWLAGAWWILGTIGVYSLLSFIREITNYLFVGKPFDWMWLVYLKFALESFFSESFSNQEKMKINWKETFRILSIIFGISLVVGIVLVFFLNYFGN